jgi:hypothetical protein
MKRFVTRLQSASELMEFFWRNKMWWLTPVIVMLFLIGLLAITAQSSAIAPFIYTLF